MSLTAAKAPDRADSLDTRLQDDAQGRRAFLATAAALALGGLAARSEAQAGPDPGREAAQNWRSPTNRLVRRITHGIDPIESQTAARMGFRAYLERQLDPDSIVDTDCERVVAGRWPRTTWTPQRLWDNDDDYPSWLAVQLSTIFRAVHSRRLLQERMVEFWTDHFHVNIEKTSGALALVHVRDAIRRNALGNFHHLLRATAFSPAMLTYLDNDDNSGEAPNINYTRELFELHTVGVDGGYIGRDLRQAALVLSGWTWEYRKRHPNSGRYRFVPDQHAPGTKRVMGQVYTEAGRAEGELLLRFLAYHPNTARNVTRKLVRWFLGEASVATVQPRAQQEFLRTGGDIKSVLRVILTPENLLAAKPRFKRPFHLMVSALRGCRSRVAQYEDLLYTHLKGAGMGPLEWEMPDGYPDRFEFWGPSMANRLTFALSVGSDSICDVTTDVMGRFGATLTPEACTTAIDSNLFGGEMSTADRTALHDFLAEGLIDEERLRMAVALALASPSFQWY